MSASMNVSISTGISVKRNDEYELTKTDRGNGSGKENVGTH